MDKSLQVVEQKEVLFYDDRVVAVRAEDGKVYVPIRPFCDLLGIDPASQRRRIYRDPVLSEVSQSCDVVTTSQGQAEQRRSMLCLPLDYLNGWMFGINANRVKPELKDRLVRYQRECYQVLSEAFQEGRLTADPTFDELLEIDSPAAQAYKIAAAMMQLARQQLLLENRVESKFQEYDERLEAVEATLGDPGRHITPDTMGMNVFG